MYDKKCPRPALGSVSSAVISSIAVLIVSMAGSAGAVSLQDSIDTHFANVMQSFYAIASSPSSQSTKISTTERYFVSSLKKNQVIHTLLRTNSKGKIITEVVRGKVPERNYRDVSGQRWFSYVKEKQEDYYGMVKDEEQGRYYLFWSKPVMRGERFLGAVVAKIDLWDSFHKYASNVEEPFLVRLQGKSLYSNKWKDSKEFQNVELTIPGIEKISLRLEPEAVAPQAVALPSVVPAAAEPVQAKAVAAPAVQFPLKGILKNKVVIGFSVVISIALIVAIIQLITRFRNWMLLRKIDQADKF